MNYNDIPVIIPVLASAYVLTVYVLLALAQRGAKITKNKNWQQQGVTDSGTNVN